VTSTQIPTTLHEYQQYVRTQALQAQKDMGWPDDQMNQTLAALGLPPKQTYLVSLEVTGKALVQVVVEDAESEEAAKESFRSKTSEEVRGAMTASGLSVGHFSSFFAEVAPTPKIEVGQLDTTLTNPAVARMVRARGGERNVCEQYQRSGYGGHYCTRPRNHGSAEDATDEDKRHAWGDGATIRSTWMIQNES
jgi:hypothetical protein